MTTARILMLSLVLTAGVLVSAASAIEIGQASLLQAPADGVSIERLAFTPPLPFAMEPTTASLDRIAIEAGSALNLPDIGPVLIYIEQGTLDFDLRQHPVSIVKAGGDSDKASQRKVGRGQIPAGYGVYSADGDLGAPKNSGGEDVVLLAVWFVAQLPEAGYESAGGAATAVTGPARSPAP
ncbi:MAG: hypothetical protein IT337_15955 [Thermomicrobiales bacterium]|nr:hypothetical protein [Thermomicrobiales bacterium]